MVNSVLHEHPPLLSPLQFQEEKGNVKFELGVGLKEFVGEDGKLTGVAVGDGSKVIDADIAIVGIGVVPNTGFLKDSGLNLTRRGEVVVDEVKVAQGVSPCSMRTSRSSL